MTARDFCYWLHGYFEMSAHGAIRPVSLTVDQLDMIQRHLKLVFKNEERRESPPTLTTAVTDFSGSTGFIC